MSAPAHPVLANARREALVIFATWLLATAYCCGYYLLFGTSRPEAPLGPDQPAMPEMPASDEVGLE